MKKLPVPIQICIALSVIIALFGLVAKDIQTLGLAMVLFILTFAAYANWIGKDDDSQDDDLNNQSF